MNQVPDSDFSRRDLTNRSVAEIGGQSGHVLDSAGMPAGGAAPVRVTQILAEIEPSLRDIIGSTISWQLTAESGLWPVLCDPGGLQDTIVNLVINAREAMPHGGRIGIDLANADASFCDNNDIAPPERYQVVTLTDTGTGMTPDVQDRMFDPYFTTKAAQGAKGLGMPAVRRFLDDAGGHIRVTSAPAHGTAIMLFLPRYDDRSHRLGPTYR